MIAVDTNIYVYALDGSSPSKQSQSAALFGSMTGLAIERPLLWQVACEFLAFLRRQQAKQRLDDTAVELEVASLLSNHRLIAPTSNVIPIALELTRTHSLSHWDSLLLAACVDAGIETFYSEDMSHGMTYDTVTVINPFKSA